jgi:cell wall-associated NlpC family hydrolase
MALSVHQVRVRVGIAALVAATSFGAVAASISPASAAPIGVETVRRAPDPLAAFAAVALDELETYIRTGAQGTWTAYTADRDSIATEAANRLGIDPARMRDAWSAADQTHQVALMAAFSQLGVPYRHNQSRPGVGFDCSGLTTYAWGVAGTTLPRQSGSQIRTVARVDHQTAEAGDLVYYPGHVMMYLGVDSAIVHAPNSGRTVQVDTTGRTRGVRFGDPTG